MSAVFNVYCDESCHLENDRQPIMVLGAVWCPLERAKDISAQLAGIKARHGLKAQFEIKWTKVSGSWVAPYLDFIEYFFAEKGLHFRALIASKGGLRHDDFGQSHDEWYYKMYFDMLKVLFSPHAQYRVYLDIKDTRGRVKVAKLHEVLCKNMYDFSREIIERVQIIRSEESEIMQLADLLIGAVSYVNRGQSANSGKVLLVNRMRERSGYSLTRTTLFREEKVNLFRWQPQESGA
jgi:hypothetical protein